MNNLEREIAKSLLSIEAIFLRPEEPFTWASGIKSPIYCDNRLTLTAPEVRTLIESSLAEKVKDHPALLGFDLFNEPYPGSDGGKIFRKLILNLSKTVITDKRCNKPWLIKQLVTGNAHRVLEPFEDPDLFRKVTKAGDELQRKFDEEVYSKFINRLSKAVRNVTDKGIIIVESCYYTNLGIPFCMPPVNYDGVREDQFCYSPHGYDLTVDTPTYDYASNSRVWSILKRKKELRISGTLLSL